MTRYDETFGHLTEAQAYPCGRTYGERATRRYEPGDLVRIGPGYQMGGTYAHDWCSGRYARVAGVLGSGPETDYKLCFVADADERPDPEHWDAIVHPSRLVPIPTSAEGGATFALLRFERTDDDGAQVFGPIVAASDDWAGLWLRRTDRDVVVRLEWSDETHGRGYPLEGQGR